MYPRKIIDLDHATLHFAPAAKRYRSRVFTKVCLDGLKVSGGKHSYRVNNLVLVARTSWMVGHVRNIRAAA